MMKNPLDGKELLVSGAALAVGFLATDFLDRWLVYKYPQKNASGVALDPATAASAIPDMARIGAQAGASLAFGFLSMKVGGKAKPVMQGLALGAATHLIAQVLKSYFVKLMKTNTTITQQLYPDVYAAENAAGQLAGLPRGAMGVGVSPYSYQRSPIAFNRNILPPANQPVGPGLFAQPRSGPTYSPSAPVLTASQNPSAPPSRTISYNPGAPMGGGCGPNGGGYGGGLLPSAPPGIFTGYPAGYNAPDVRGMQPYSASSASQDLNRTFNAAMDEIHQKSGCCGNGLSGIPKATITSSFPE